MLRARSPLARPGPAIMCLVASLSTPVSSARAAPSRSSPPSESDESLVHGVERALLVREALARNPGLKAAAHRVRAMRAMSRAEDRLPDPEVMFQIWQVPFEHPASFRDSQMIMAGVSQTIPAPGSLSAHAEAREHAATAEEAMLADRARDLVRDVQHAYVDLTESVARHRAHLEHHGVGSRLLAAAQARQAAGGMLDDVMQASLGLARLDADIAMESASITRAKARLNGLLARPFDAPIGDPPVSEPETVTMTPAALLELAERTRPDLGASRARAEAERATLESARREASLPSFTAGALYFAPTTNMPFNGYGASLSMTLPWVWGGNARKEEAERAALQAAELDGADVRLRLGVDVGTAAATTQAAVERLRVLRHDALPAARRAFDVGFATYASGRGDLLGVLRAEQAIVDTEMDIVAARASLDHALADLDWSVGALLPRAPLDPSPPAGH